MDATVRFGKQYVVVRYGKQECAEIANVGKGICRLGNRYKAVVRIGTICCEEAEVSGRRIVNRYVNHDVF